MEQLFIRAAQELEQELKQVKRCVETNSYVVNQQIEKLEERLISIEKKIDILLHFKSQK